MNFACYIYDADSRHLEEPHEVCTRKEHAESVDLMLCKSSYNARHRSYLLSTKYDVFGPYDMNDFCSLLNILIKPGRSWHGFRFYASMFHAMKRTGGNEGRQKDCQRLRKSKSRGSGGRSVLGEAIVAVLYSGAQAL